MSTFFPGIASSLVGAANGVVSINPPVYLGGLVLTANAPSFPVMFIPPYNSLYVYCNVTGYGGTDVVSLQFNGDTGTNYCDRTVTLAQGTVTPLINTETASTTLIRMGVPVNVGRTVFAQIVNNATRNKVVQTVNAVGSANAATPPLATLSSGGIWFNTTAQITSLQVLTAGGANILAGSSLLVFGGV